jgi:hypothetical protein
MSLVMMKTSQLSPLAFALYVALGPAGIAVQRIIADTCPVQDSLALRLTDDDSAFRLRNIPGRFDQWCKKLPKFELMLLACFGNYSALNRLTHKSQL